MAKIKKVFEVAKELGVNSKAIVEKCQAEGVPDIVNHMSPVKLGLVETIRQWFSAAPAPADAATAVETAAKVDVTKVKRARRRKIGGEAHDHEHDDHHDHDHDDSHEHDAPSHETSTAVAEPPSSAAPSVKAHPTAAPPPPPPPVPVTPVSPPVAHPTVKQVEPPLKPAPLVPHRPAEPAAPAVAAHARKPVGPVGKINVPVRPTVVRPAGQQLEKPQQAVLKGPTVVRIEKADDIRAPKPRRPAGDRPASGGSSPGEVPGIARSRGPIRGRGAGAQAPEEAESAAARNRRRSANLRRGRSAEALPSGPTQFSEADLIELDARLKGAPGYLKQRRRDLKKREDHTLPAAGPASADGKVEIAEPIFIKELSSVTGIKAADIIKYLFKKGTMATINSAIAAEAAMEVCLEHDIDLVVREQKTAEQEIQAEFARREQVEVRARPPIVTVLGHVDHGKTSLLDAIRKSDVAAHEAGGITQHVGAYRVTIKGHDAKDKTVVFLDTPGHEAFTSMRARGAKMTDLVVLVVAADDGVMPQTVESINHAKAAGVPIVVALNKIDKPEATEANVRKIFGQLAEHGLNPVDWGGTTEVVRTSATGGKGVTDLLEVLDYQAELLELKADFGGTARGTVIEAQMQAGRGCVARVLVQDGHLNVGDFIVIGRAFGRVRDMTDDRGNPITEAGPATPLELSGIDMIPDAGDKFYVTDTLQQAEEIANQFRDKERTLALAAKTKVTLANLAESLAAGKTRELRVVLKADVQGSIDVLRKSLEDLGNAEVGVRVLHAAVGGITESDVLLADASEAVIVGFHVIAPAAVKDIAEQRGVDIRIYRIIYEATDQVRKALEGMLEPETKEEELGQATVREAFNISKVGTVAGCMVTTGTIQRAAKLRLVRDGIVVTDNRNVESLRRVKEDVKEVRQGFECGIKFAGFDDIKPGDTVVCYDVKKVKRTLG